jgi:dTMP kinase
LAPTIIQKLNDGVDIVLDRYVYSGVAYTAAKGIDTQWCYSPDIGLPRPDLTIFLSLDDTSDRAGFGNERYEVQEFQVKVKKQFELFFKEKGWSTIIVDGKSIEKVEKEISELVNSLLDKDLEEIELFI